MPQANLTSLDPVWTTATVTRNFSLMVYETLYGRDEKFNPQPLMVEGHVIDDDGKRWTMRLREGLVFHDGTPVLARDCVASLQRWLKRDAVSVPRTGPFAGAPFWQRPAKSGKLYWYRAPLGGGIGVTVLVSVAVNVTGALRADGEPLEIRTAVEGSRVSTWPDRLIV